MAWTTPVTTFASGNVLTAAQMNAIGDNLWAGGPVYDTFATLSAAIPSPFEGQRAYLTAPTSATITATADTTYIPSGIAVIYNGAAWVCITEVGGFTAAGGTYNSTTWGPTLTGSPGANPSVVIQTGATALVTITADLQVSTTMTWGIDVAISGATSRNAGVTPGQALNWAKSSDVGLNQTVNHSFIVSGLTAGVNTFTLNYNTNNTGTASKRRLTVKGIA